MKLRNLLGATILLVILAGPLNADTKAEILLALDYYADMWNQGEVDELRAYYHKDFVLVTNQGIVQRDQLLGDISSIGQPGEQRGKLDYSQLEVRELGDENAVAYGNMSLKFDDGSEITNWFSTIYVKTPFGWRAILTSN